MSAPCGFDKNSGVFTVPQDGLYLFTYNLVKYMKTSFYAQIRVDGVSVCQTFSPEYEYWGHSTSCSTIQNLKSGQTVDVFLKNGKISHLGHDYTDNQFHGVLLQ